MTIPLFYQRFTLPFTGVLLRCLDETKQPIPGAFASGFIRNEQDGHYLYTCWHVITGFDPNDVKVGHSLPNRKFLEVALQFADKSRPELQRIGGVQTAILPLYDNLDKQLRPLWLQDDVHVPHSDLNAIGIYVPFWHDVVKIKLPTSLSVSEIQVIDEQRLNKSLIGPGDKCFVVGYPYGFSCAGSDQPTAIVLTRFAASQRIVGRREQFFLESIGAPGMSGGPVFVERSENVLLAGIYTGLLFPDNSIAKNERTTALGTVSNLTFLLKGALSLVSEPSHINPKT